MSQETNESTSQSAVVVPRPAPPKVDRMPPFRVLLHNDDVNSVEHVVNSIVQITPLNVERAAQVTLEADAQGVALVLVTHRELAELYQEQFTSRSLTVTIEPAN